MRTSELHLFQNEPQSTSCNTMLDIYTAEVDINAVKLTDSNIDAVFQYVNKIVPGTILSAMKNVKCIIIGKQVDDDIGMVCAVGDYIIEPPWWMGSEYKIISRKAEDFDPRVNSIRLNVKPYDTCDIPMIENIDVLQRPNIHNWLRNRSNKLKDIYDNI